MEVKKGSVSMRLMINKEEAAAVAKLAEKTEVVVKLWEGEHAYNKYLFLERTVVDNGRFRQTFRVSPGGHMEKVAEVPA